MYRDGVWYGNVLQLSPLLPLSAEFLVVFGPVCYWAYSAFKAQVLGLLAVAYHMLCWFGAFGRHWHRIYTGLLCAVAPGCGWARSSTCTHAMQFLGSAMYGW